MAPLRLPKSEEQAQPRRLLGTRPLSPPTPANDNRRPPLAVVQLVCAWTLVGVAATLALWLML